MAGRREAFQARPPIGAITANARTSAAWALAFRARRREAPINAAERQQERGQRTVDRPFQNGERGAQAQQTGVVQRPGCDQRRQRHAAESKREPRGTAGSWFVIHS